MRLYELKDILVNIAKNCEDLRDGIVLYKKEIIINNNDSQQICSNIIKTCLRKEAWDKKWTDYIDTLARQDAERSKLVSNTCKLTFKHTNAEYTLGYLVSEKGLNKELKNNSEATIPFYNITEIIFYILIIFESISFSKSNLVFFKFSICLPIEEEVSKISITASFPAIYFLSYFKFNFF